MTKPNCNRDRRTGSKSMDLSPRFAAETIRQLTRERLSLPGIARLKVRRRQLHPEIALLSDALGEITHQRQHRADRTSGSDEMNGVDEFSSLLDSQRLQGCQIIFPIAVADHDDSEPLSGEDRACKVGLQERANGHAGIEPP